MTLDSELSSPGPYNASNSAQLIERDDKIQATEKRYKDYDDANIYHNHSDFPMIWETVK